MTVRAKFKCTEKTEFDCGFRVKFHPVTSGSKENQEFYRFTPSGSLEISTINAEAAKQFTVGREYYLDLAECAPVEG